MRIYPNAHDIAICRKIWPSGVSPKRASKMQLRDVDLRSVGPSVQKLWPTTFFARKMPCILHCNAKKIRSMFSRLVRDLVQKAKWSEIFRRKRIQAVPTISNNLWESVILQLPALLSFSILTFWPQSLHFCSIMRGITVAIWSLL